MAKNLKGGYKIVSLNGLDLVGESLAIEGLYDKLAKSYDKPILVTGIVIDGEKKKNAFVQVEVLDDGIKINDLYGYDLLVEEDGDITVSANPQELPNTADASAGQVLKLDAQKKPVWGDEAELPSTASASQGNALVLDAQKEPVWGKGGTKLYRHEITTKTATAYQKIYFINADPTPVTELELDDSDIMNHMNNSFVWGKADSYAQGTNAVFGSIFLLTIFKSDLTTISIVLHYYTIPSATDVAVTKSAKTYTVADVATDDVTEL